MSTACFFGRVYNEVALREIGALGIHEAEIFFSAQAEYREDFVRELVRIKEGEGIDVVSVHALPTQFEPQLFSSHKRQYEEALGIYEKVLAAAQQLSAGIYVFHGPVHLKIARKLNVDMEFAGERVTQLAELAKSYGVVLCYENVHWCWYNMPGFATELKRHCHSDNLYFTLDMKQAAQSGFDLFAYIDDMGDRLHHVHVCDYFKDPEQGVVPCLPFAGQTDWSKLRNVLRERGYKGRLMLEVYSRNYDSYEHLQQTFEQVKQFFA